MRNGTIAVDKIYDPNPNSKLSPSACKLLGKCVNCGNKGLWTDFGTPGKWRPVRCPGCGRKGKQIGWPKKSKR